MRYQELDIYKSSLKLFFKSHQLSLKLPSYEKHELGSQLRRSSDPVNSNIVEGYGRKMYKRDYLKFLIYSLSSNDETVNHLIKIKHRYSYLGNEIDSLISKYEILGKQIAKFIQYVRKSWNPDTN